jgi:hypothetical protein
MTVQSENPPPEETQPGGSSGRIRIPSQKASRIALAVSGVLILASLLVVVGGDDGFGLVEQRPVALSYLGIFFLIAADAVVPIFPGETTLNAASTLAASGDDLKLLLVILSGALGAIVGDSILFMIARRNRARVQPKISAAKSHVARSGVNPVPLS